MKNGTVLVYSSHNRGQYLHERFLIDRALGGWANKRILFLTFSEGTHGEMGPQEFAYPDGRHWAFGGGDHLVRIRTPDYGWDESWIFTSGGECIHHGTHARDGYRGIEHLLDSH